MSAFSIEWLEAALPRLLDASMRGAVVLLVALVLTTLLRRRSAATRHAIWVGAIAIQLLLPALSLWGPTWRVAAPAPVLALVASVERSASPSVAPPSLSLERSRVRENTGSGERSASSGPTVGNTSSNAASAQTPRQPTVPLRTVLLVAWALGAAAVLLRLVVGTTFVATLARRGARIDDGHWLSLAQRLATTLGIQRPLILLRGDRVGVPITWGVVYPIVLLPDDADSWPEERKRFVLVHEMAHVKRLDALTQLVGQIVLALFWFDPLVWIANRRMQLEREHACDDYVIRHGTQPSQYAADLLEMVRTLGTPSHRAAQPAFAALAMARRSEFEGRMLSILDPVLDRHPLKRGRTLMSALVTLLLVVPLAALQPYRPATPAVTPTPSVAARTASQAATTPPATSRLPDARAPESAHVASQTHAIPKEHAPAGDPIDQLLAKDVATLGAAVEQLDGQRSSLAGAPLRACDGTRYSETSRTSISVHTDSDDPSDSQISYLNVFGERCTQAMIAGRVTYTPAEDDVVSLGSSAARAFFRERSASDDRSLSIVRGSGGELVRTYRRNGADAPFDEAARRWFATFLPTVLAETSENAGPRVARWRADGGTDGVLRRIGTLRSTGARRAHYEALLGAGRLSDGEMQRVVSQAGRDLKGSSGDLRAVLTKAAPSARNLSRNATSLTEAIGAVASSGDRTAVLEIYGKSADRDVLLAVMRLAQDIPSSGDKTRLLIGLTSRYLGGNDAALRTAYFTTAATIPSSGDLRRVLTEAVDHATSSDAVAAAVIATSEKISSSGDRSSVLIELASRNALRTKALRDAYLQSAQGIGSSSDLARTLTALARQ